VLAGVLDAAAVATLWAPAHAALPRVRRLDLAGLTRADGAGAALVQALTQAKPALVVLPPPASVAQVLDRFAAAYKVAAPRGGPVLPFVPAVGKVAVDFAGREADAVVFLGRTAAAIAGAIRRPGTFRLDEALRQAEAVGTRALPLILMLGFLIGLILAFQSAVPMRQFGAEVFVANLVAMSLLRELGPLMTAVVLAGRSGSAFAAEIGTMKVNEEIDALTVMGLDPMRFLVLPRLAGAMVAMPVLTVAMNFAGLLGMGVVMTGFGFPPEAIARQVVSATTPNDLFGGLFKAMVFGLVVALIGCRRGMATGQGPKAVGESTTATVVGGIVAIVLLDGAFAVLFNLLGL
jgi:phospholipid/cholesterol/gamma-HCH transport system permease protein